MQIEDYLVQSGQYAELADALRDQLERAGWYDDVNTLATREVAAAPELDYSALARSIEAKALALVPDAVKVEMLQKIRRLVDEVVERA